MYKRREASFKEENLNKKPSPALEVISIRTAILNTIPMGYLSYMKGATD